MQRPPHTARPPARLLPALVLALLGASAPLVAGCSDEGPIEAEPGSVREALFRFNAALEKKDKEEARRWVLDGPHYQRAFEILYFVSVVQQDFIEKVTDKWGAESLQIFLEPPGADLDALVPYAPREELEKVIVNEVGEIAVATFEDGSRMRFERVDGRWRWNTIGSDRAEDLNQAIPQFRLMEAYALGIQKALEEIDQPGIDADYFDLLLGRQLEAAVRDFEESMKSFYEDLQKRAEEEQRDAVGPEAPGAEAPAQHDDHAGHDHGGGR